MRSLRKSVFPFVGLFILAGGARTVVARWGQQGPSTFPNRPYDKLIVGRTPEFHTPEFIAKYGVPSYINDSDFLNIGDVVSVGTRGPAGDCKMPPLFVTTWGEPGRYKGMTFGKDEACRLSVKEKINRPSGRRLQNANWERQQHGILGLVAAMNLQRVAAVFRRVQQGYQTTSHTVNTWTYGLGGTNDHLTERASTGYYSRYWSPNCTVVPPYFGGNESSYVDETGSGHSNAYSPGVYPIFGPWVLDNDGSDIHTPWGTNVYSSCNDGVPDRNRAYTYGYSSFHYSSTFPTLCPADPNYPTTPATGCYHTLLAGDEADWAEAVANTVGISGTYAVYWTYGSETCDSYYGC